MHIIKKFIHSKTLKILFLDLEKIFFFQKIFFFLKKFGSLKFTKFSFFSKQTIINNSINIFDIKKSKANYKKIYEKLT